VVYKVTRVKSERKGEERNLLKMLSGAATFKFSNSGHCGCEEPLAQPIFAVASIWHHCALIRQGYT
jgi:hypothetical protein